jgi:uncharacterized protein DUF4242
MPHVLVERRFDTALTDAEYEATRARLRPCRELHDVKWVRTYLSHDRRRMICEYEARDAETVRNVFREARTPFEVVWTVDVVQPEPSLSS